MTGNYAAIIGQTWIRKLRLNLSNLKTHKEIEHLGKQISNVNITEQIFEKYSDVFIQCVTEIPYAECKLKLRDDTKPQPVPYSLINKVNTELDNLQKHDIIYREGIYYYYFYFLVGYLWLYQSLTTVSNFVQIIR